MLKILNFSHYSLSTKVIFSLIFFIFLFIFIRFSLVIPKAEKEAYNRELENISRSLFFIKEQMKIAVKSIQMQTFQEAEVIKGKIVAEIKDIKLQSKIYKDKQLFNILSKAHFSKFCGYKLTTKNSQYKEIKGKDLFDKNNLKVLDKWQSFEKKITNRILQRKRVYLFYNTKLDENSLLTLGCHLRLLNPEHEIFEEELRTHIQKNLSLIESTINSKTIILWINPDLKNDNKNPLFEKEEKLRQKKYRISKLSNTKTLTTTNLTTKEILQLRDKEPIEYILNGKEVVTWVLNLSIKNSNNLYTLIYTVNKKDLFKKSNFNLFILLPETLIAITIAFILFLFIFKKLFEKIEEKTIEVKNSLKEKEILLEEKETLLKEIHHRVKNNLAKTITLIELQENDVKDEKTKKSLIDIKERIYTMELLHRKLYESINLNEIPLKEYIVDLIESITKAYTIDKKVDISYKIDEINLDIETAMPYGLILNELITNAFKYAFVENEKPTLKIEVKRKGNNLVLIIKDNGKGLNEKFLKDNSSLGLKLINTLVKFQLTGSLDYFYDNGAKFIITGKIKQQQNL